MFIFSKKHSWLTGKTKFKNVPNSITMTRAGHTSQQSDTVLGFKRISPSILPLNILLKFHFDSEVQTSYLARIRSRCHVVATYKNYRKPSSAIVTHLKMLIFKLKAACRQNSFRNSLMSFTYICTDIEHSTIQNLVFEGFYKFIRAQYCMNWNILSDVKGIVTPDCIGLENRKENKIQSLLFRLLLVIKDGHSHFFPLLHFCADSE